MRQVHIEKGTDGEILNSNLYAAYEGFSKMQYDISFYTDPKTIYAHRDAIVCGTVGSVRMSLLMHRITPPPLDYPEELKAYLGREIWPSTLGEIRAPIFNGTAKPLFVKPQAHHSFNGAVLRKARDLVASARFDPDTPVWVSDPIIFLSEYRVFVQDGRVLDIRPYHYHEATSALTAPLPDRVTIKQMISDYTSAPLCYALDVGVNTGGKTLLVEVNDAFALGAYGLNSVTYARFIEARWDELTGSDFHL
jgi:hypothetical protein